MAMACCYSSMVFARVVTAEHRLAVHIFSALIDPPMCCDSCHEVISARIEPGLPAFFPRQLSCKVHQSTAFLPGFLARRFVKRDS
jgi:hypothetical protein